jgi:hypothetical protein
MTKRRMKKTDQKVLLSTKENQQKEKKKNIRKKFLKI